MLNIKKIIAIVLVATFLAGIPLAVLNVDSEITTVVFTIEVDDHYERPSAPGKPSPTSKDYKILLSRYVTDVPVVLTLYASTPEGISAADFVKAVDSAAEAWDSASTKNLYEITTTNDGTGVVATDGTNALFFADLDSGIIAQASVMYNRFTRTIVECDIQFNIDFVWGDAETNPEVMDLQNIATHELGHFFNLADIYDSSKSYLTMYGRSTEGDIEKRSLAPGDIAGIVAVFGP